MNKLTITAKEAGIAAVAAVVALCGAAGVGYILGFVPGQTKTFGATSYDAGAINQQLQAWSAAIVAVLTIAYRNASPACKALLQTIAGLIAQAMKDESPAPVEPTGDGQPLRNLEFKVNELAESVAEIRAELKAKVPG